jgi:hypothetical protein
MYIPYLLVFVPKAVVKFSIALAAPLEAITERMRLAGTEVGGRRG